MAMLYEALAHAGQRSGHFTIVATTGDEPDAERTAVEALLQRRVDGVILSTARLGDDFPSQDRKSTRLNSSHANISYAVFCLKKNNETSVSPPRSLEATRSTKRSF